LGDQKAGEILFYALQFTLQSGTTWATVGDGVAEAAFQRFNNCSAGSTYNAALEQGVVNQAFAAIGYPRAIPTIRPCN
jgi:hypothetical protein